MYFLKELALTVEKFNYEYEMEYIFSYTAHLEAEPIGPVADGLRINFNFTGGEIIGQNIKGVLGKVGADWLTIRTDGVGILDIRGTITTDDGAKVYLAYNGIMDLGPNGYDAFLNGSEPPAEIQLRGNPHFQVAEPKYEWLNRGFFVNIGKAILSENIVKFDVYRVN